MKKMISFFLKKQILFIALVTTIVLFSACKKALDVTQPPSSGVMAFNLIPDRPAIGFAVSNNILTNTPLAYTNYTGNYLSVPVGTREIESYDINSDSTLATATQEFELKNYYSIFALGANKTYRNLIVNDNLDSLSSSTGQAFVRYINAIPDSSKPAVTITANGNNLVNDAASFATISNFKGIDPGDISIAVSNGSTISTNRIITLEKGKVYTVLLVGIPAATDTAKAVQIKYIVNGTVTP